MRVTVEATNGEAVIVREPEGSLKVSSGGPWISYPYPVDAAIAKFYYTPVDGVEGDDGNVDALIDAASESLI